MEGTQKLEGKNAEETVEGKAFKNIRSQLAEALAAGDKARLMLRVACTGRGRRLIFFKHYFIGAFAI